MVVMKRSLPKANSHQVSSVHYKEQYGAGEIRVLVVSDHKLFVDGLRTLLQLEPDIRMTQTSYEQLTQNLRTEKAEPEVVLFDRERCENTFLLEEVMHQWKHTKVIIISPLLEPLHAALPQNIRGVLVKSLRPNSVAQTIRMVNSGTGFLPIEVVQGMPPHRR